MRYIKTYILHREEQCGEGKNDGYSEEILESRASESWADHSVRNSTRNRVTGRVQEFKEDGYQLTSTTAVQGRERWICGIA